MICGRMKKSCFYFDKRLQLDHLTGKPESKVSVRYFLFPHPHALPEPGEGEWLISPMTLTPWHGRMG